MNMIKILNYKFIIHLSKNFA